MVVKKICFGGGGASCLPDPEKVLSSRFSGAGVKCFFVGQHAAAVGVFTNSNMEQDFHF